MKVFTVLLTTYLSLMSLKARSQQVQHVQGIQCDGPCPTTLPQPKQSGSNSSQSNRYLSDAIPTSQEYKAAKKKCENAYGFQLDAANNEFHACENAIRFPNGAYAGQVSSAFKKCSDAFEAKRKLIETQHEICINDVVQHEISSNTYTNSNNLSFAGTPEQQRATQQHQLVEQQRQQDEFQRQQLNQNIGSAINNIQTGFTLKGRETVGQFSNELTGNQGKVDVINNQSNQNQPRDGRGIMDVARGNSRSTEALGPGQETDDDDKKLSNDPETKRLVRLTDSQFEAEHQNFTKENKDRPNEESINYSSETSRLAESEREIRRRQADKASGSSSPDFNQPTSSQNESTDDIVADRVQDFINSMRDRPFDWNNFTHEERVRLVYIGYIAISAAQAATGALLIGAGSLAGLTGVAYVSDAVSGAPNIINPFLHNP